MITFMEPKEKTKESEKCLDSQLWHACAGSVVQMPIINSKVFYFPQGHAEHASGTVDFRNFPRIPALIPCKVSGIKFMADTETDEVFAKIRLVPITHNEANFDADDFRGIGPNGSESNQDKPTSFAKTLTQSDANNGGGFSVPRYCAETIFPRLDYSADPPVQTILAKDVHGETWKFRHIYRGTPRRHLLTTGWSTFVNHKKLVAGDSIVFLRAENGDLCLGVRRAKRGIGDGPNISMGWNHSNYASPYGGDLPGFFREDEGKLQRNGNVGTNTGRVKPEDVIEAVNLALSGRPFDVVYYPRASTPEFCVRASLVNAALQLRWCSGMRFKMAFETEDSSRVSWFMGTIFSVQAADPIRWPDSPWRLLQVAWDEPDLLQNVKRVSPWLVELVSNMIPSIQLSPFSPPLKKLRVARQSEISLPPLSFNNSNNLIFNTPYVNNCLPININNNNDSNPAGMQGARHNNADHHQYAFSLSSDLYKLQSSSLPMGLFPSSYNVITPTAATEAFITDLVMSKPGNDATVSCLLTMGQSSDCSKKVAPFLLFGKQIHTEKQMSDRSSSSEANGNVSDGSGSGLNQNDGVQSELTGHCKVFLEYEDVGRTLDLSVLNSYEELYEKLKNMFSIGISETSSRVQYRDASGTVRQLGNEPFSGFVRGARRLTIQSCSSSENEGVQINL